MVNRFTYTTTGVCSRLIEIEVEDNTVKFINFVGGCNGNLKGISMLCIGQDIDTIIDKLGDIDCNNRGTSCPQQLAIALSQLRNK